MPRIRMIVQYDGSNYVGWQTQPNGLAVQEVLERELMKITGKPAILHASGRTDSKVHALAQVCHFDTESRIPPEKFAYALNAGLPTDIRVKYSDQCEDDFHSRFDVQKKHYCYQVYHGPHADAFLRHYALHVHEHLDVAAMQEAARYILGEHDFAAFKAAGTKVDSTVRTIYRSEWEVAGQRLLYHVAGSGFLYNMVRILVGTMLRVGMGYDSPEVVLKALQSKYRDDAGPTAPAYGLMLMRVEYAQFDTADYVEIIRQP